MTDSPTDPPIDEATLDRASRILTALTLAGLEAVLQVHPIPAVLVRIAPPIATPFPHRPRPMVLPNIAHLLATGRDQWLGIPLPPSSPNPAAGIPDACLIAGVIATWRHEFYGIIVVRCAACGGRPSAVKLLGGTNN